MGEGDHGDVGEGALSGLFGGLNTSSGLVASGDVGRVDDAFDVVPPHGGCLSGQAFFFEGGSVQPGEQLVNLGILCRVWARERAVSVADRGEVGADGGGFHFLFDQID